MRIESENSCVAGSYIVADGAKHTPVGPSLRIQQEFKGLRAYVDGEFSRRLEVN